MMDIGGAIVAFFSSVALVAAILIFVPVLVLFIVFLVKAIKNKWTKKYLIPVIIFGAILAVFATLSLRYIIENIIRFVSLSFGSGGSSSIQ